MRKSPFSPSKFLPSERVTRLRDGALTPEQRSFVEQAHEISGLEALANHLPVSELVRSGDWEQDPTSDYLRRTPSGREKWWRRKDEASARRLVAAMADGAGI